MLTIEYRLVGTGWSECVLSADGMEVTVTASYLGDALGDLARAVLDLVNGETRSSCSFDEEPSEYRWVFSRAMDSVVIRVLWFTELWGNQLDEDGEAVFCAETSVKELATVLVATLDAVLSEYGVEGYLEKWAAHGFPVQEYAALAAAGPRVK